MVLPDDILIACKLLLYRVNLEFLGPGLTAIWLDADFEFLHNILVTIIWQWNRLAWVHCVLL